MLLLSPSTPWAAFLLVSFFSPAAKADDCSINPLVLPIKNVTFPNGIGANRGVKLTLGGQVQGIRMTTTLNNTRVRNILDCPTQDTLEFVGCQGASGSVYDVSKGTFTEVDNIKDWNVTAVDPQPNNGLTTVLHGYDTANLTDGPAVTFGYPFEVWADVNSSNRSALGLGPKSSTIDRLVKNKHAPTSSFSVDYGSTSELYPRDGQIIFGGVNKARFDEDQKFEFPLWSAAAPAPCPLQVLVADIILTNEDGDHSLFSDEGTTVAACVDVFQNDFTLTQSMFAKFQNLTNHASTVDGVKFGGSTYPADREPLIGTLTVKLTNGLTTVIPHYELVNHERGTDARGKYAVVNNTHVTANVATGPNDLGNNITVLGGVFLSQNYLHVDYAASKFWVSPLIANGSLPDVIKTSCNATTAPPSSGPSVGVQVGITFTVLAAVILLITLWFWMKNRKQNPIASLTGPTAAIPRSEKLGDRDSKSSTAGFARYNDAAPGQRRLELEEPAPAYSGHSEWPRPNLTAAENASSYYIQQPPQEGQTFELADTSPSPPPLATWPAPKRQDSVVSPISENGTQSSAMFAQLVANLDNVATTPAAGKRESGMGGVKPNPSSFV